MLVFLSFGVTAQEIQNPCIGTNNVPSINNFIAGFRGQASFEPGATLADCVRLTGRGTSITIANAVSASGQEGSIATVTVFLGQFPNPVAIIPITAGTNAEIPVGFGANVGFIFEFDNPGTFTLTLSGFDSGNGNGNNTAVTVIVAEEEGLPVTWTQDLTAEPFGELLKMHYAVSEQVDVAGYELEAAYEDENFVKVKDIAYQENGSLETDYTVVTNYPLKSAYYRIKQLDYDGKYDYSNIVYVDGAAGSAQSMLVFPNPATSRVSLSLPAGITTVDLISASGQRVRTYGRDEASRGLDVSNVPNGIYLLRAIGSSSDRGDVQRLVVRH